MIKRCRQTREVEITTPGVSNEEHAYMRTLAQCTGSLPWTIGVSRGLTRDS